MIRNILQQKSNKYEAIDIVKEYQDLSRMFAEHSKDFEHFGDIDPEALAQLEKKAKELTFYALVEDIQKLRKRHKAQEK